jgi:hypothetical protein
MNTFGGWKEYLAKLPTVATLTLLVVKEQTALFMVLQDNAEKALKLVPKKSQSQRR